MNYWIYYISNMTRVDHEPAMHMDVCEEIDKVLKPQHAKTCFMQPNQKTDFYLLLIPGKNFKTKDLSAPDW